MSYEKKKFLGFSITTILIATFIWGCSRKELADDNDGSPPTSTRPSSSRGGNTLRQVGENSSSYSRLKASHFGGEKCEFSPKCEDQCREIRNNASFKNRCERFPTDMVEVLYENFNYLKDVSRSVDQVNPSALGAFLDIDIGIVSNILDEWTNSHIERFLNWVATHPQAVEAMKEDANNELLMEALKRLNEDLYLALLTSIDQYRDTFISQAITVRNDEAIFLVMELLPDTNQKGIFFCKREEISSRSRDGSSCHYFSESRRREEHCYIHGPTVWSYINNNISVSNLGDLPAELKTESGRIDITTETCSRFCGTQGSECEF